MAKEINLLESETEAEELLLPGFSSEPQKNSFQPLDREEKLFAKRVIEALLFATSEPISFDRLREIIETKIPIKPKVLRSALDALDEDYTLQNRAFRLKETAEGYVLKTCEEYAPFIDKLFQEKRGEKLTQASTEVLAIIAYKQPITKPQIDQIRGVNSSGIIQNLLERGLIIPTGKLEAPGRPTLYSTTREFLSHFGLSDLNELPGKKEKT